MNRRNARKKKQIIPEIDNKVFLIIVIIFAVVILACLSILTYKNIRNKKKAKMDEQNRNNEIEQLYDKTNNEIGSIDTYQSDKIIRLSFVGDVNNNTKIQNTDNYNTIFLSAKEQLKDADIAIGTYSADVKTDNEKSFAKSVFDSGIDLVNISSNSNSNDKDYINEKKENLKKIGFDIIGEHEEKTEDRVKIIEKRGTKIAIVSYNEDLNDDFNAYNSDKVLADMNYAKENAKFTIVLINWKKNKSTNVSESQKNIAKDIISKGANIVVGTNSYCLQKFEMTDNEKGQAFIAYSVGNYVQTNNNDNLKLELILNLQIYVDKNGKSQIYKVNYVPMYMYQNMDNYKIMNINEEISKYDDQHKMSENANEEQDLNNAIDDKTYKILKNELNQIKKILGIS